MTDPLIVALQDAVRAGFEVSVRFSRYALGGPSYVVLVDPWTIRSGEATDRLKAFRVTRPDLTDALGNALAIVGVEIGLDRAAKAKRLESSDG